MTQFFVYVDWTLDDPPRPFYVGKGKLSRVKCLTRNKLHTHIAEKHGIARQIVFQTEDESLAHCEEVRLIFEHKTYFHGGEDCWGANFTRGGEGSIGAKHVWSEERRRIASIAQRESFSNPERIAIHAEATRKQWQDQNRRKSQSVRMCEQNPARLYPDTEDVKKHKSEGQRLRYKNPDERAKMSELTRKSCQDPEVKRKRSEAQKARRARERIAKLNRDQTDGRT